VVAGSEKTHLELLTDVLTLSHTIRATLGPALTENEGATVCIGLLAPGGYEYIVALLAIVAVGACAVPLSESCRKGVIDSAPDVSLTM
jgi:malonyl-CoA/methylmalonyl-CoA synthetase